MKSGWEKFSEVRDELVPLLERNQAEIGEGYEPYDPDWKRYEELDSSGSLGMWILREGSGSGSGSGMIIGYVVWLILRGLHNVSTRFATADLVYLVPERRNGTFGYYFLRDAIRAAEEKYRPNLVRIETCDLYEYGRLGTVLLSRMGFRQIGSVYQRERRK